MLNHGGPRSTEARLLDNRSLLLRLRLIPNADRILSTAISFAEGTRTFR